MAQARPKLNGLSDILTFFRQNETPIYFVSPMPFNLLGIDRWVRNFEYINYFDSFDGHHPHVFVPSETGPREFWSMEEIGNYLLGHKEVIDRIRKRGPGSKVVLIMFDEETEELARDLGVEIALPPAALRKRIDSKIVTTQLGNEAGVPSVPNVLGRASSYAELRTLASNANLGDDLVIQLPYGDSGRTTFFVRGEQDWDEYADEMADEELKVMKRINHMPGTLEACVTRHGTLVGPLMQDLTGYSELTPYQGGWCGNDIFPTAISEQDRKQVLAMVQALGNRLRQEGYRGVFCVDFLIDTDTGMPYLGEINPRVSGASPPTNLVTTLYGGVPLFLFHLLEFLDVDYEIDLEEIQGRWTDFDTWSQLILKQTDDAVELITRAPASGVWRMHDDGKISFVRRDLDWSNIVDENEVFYMRVYGPAQYRFHGCDMGVLITRDRMQTDDRHLLERARAWAAGIRAQFAGIPPAPDIPFTHPESLVSKLF